MQEYRTKVRGIILLIGGTIISFLVLRLVIDLLGANYSNFLISIIVSISDFFISPFSGIIVLPGLLKIINIDAVVAIFIFLLGTVAVSEVVTGLLYDKLEEIFHNFLDGLFKVVEFFLFLRIVFDFFGVNFFTSAFTQSVFSLTQWSQGILFETKLIDGIINWSAIIALIIVVLLDIFAEKFSEQIFKLFKTRLKSFDSRKIFIKKQKDHKNVSQPVIKQNITINVPVLKEKEIVIPEIVSPRKSRLEKFNKTKYIES